MTSELKKKTEVMEAKPEEKKKVSKVEQLQLRYRFC